MCVCVRRHECTKSFTRFIYSRRISNKRRQIQREREREWMRVRSREQQWSNNKASNMRFVKCWRSNWAFSLIKFIFSCKVWVRVDTTICYISSIWCVLQITVILVPDLWQHFNNYTEFHWKRNLWVKRLKSKLFAVALAVIGEMAKSLASSKTRIAIGRLAKIFLW